MASLAQPSSRASGEGWIGGATGNGPRHQPRTEMIRIEKLGKTFTTAVGDVTALENIDVAIKKGEFVSIVGPSGCGKSTLLMCVAGLIEASAGSVMVGSRRVSGPFTELGIVFQEPLLLDWRTVLGNVLFQIEMRGLDPKAYESRARELLTRVGLGGFEGKSPWELSGGMRQRVAICRALIHDPPLLLMDEPFGALDTLTREQMNVDLQRLCAQTGKTALFITHSISEAVFLSDRVLVMTPRPGRIIADLPIAFAADIRRLSIRTTPEFAEQEKKIYSIFRSIGVLRDE
jgi:NitT/TauT family transport system ATP-binding protein